MTQAESVHDHQPRDDDRFRSFLQQEQEDREAIRVKRLYVEVAGDIACGVLLSDIVYWHGEDQRGRQRLRIQRDGHMWLAKSADEMFEECGLTPKQAARCIKQLEALGVIATALYQFKGAPTKHFRIVPDRFIELVDAARERMKARRGDHRISTIGENGFRPKGEIHFDQRGKSISTKGENPYTVSTTASTTTTPPTPLKGEDAPPTSSGDAPGPAVVEEMATEKNDPTPPTPSPRADTVDNAAILDLRSRRREKEALQSTGWHEYPDRLQKIRAGLEKGWTRANPARFDRKALEMVARSVAPDEADLFQRKTVAYLKSVDDPQYLLSLRRWLEEWRDRDPDRDRKMNQAEINSAWLLAMRPITREEIAQ